MVRIEHGTYNSIDETQPFQTVATKTPITVLFYPYPQPNPEVNPRP